MFAPFFACVTWAGRAILFCLFLIAGAPVISGVKTRALEYKTTSGAYQTLYFAITFFIRASG